MDFLKTQFDKLLLTTLLMVAVVLVVLLIRWHMGEAMIAWAQALAAGFSGALMREITGAIKKPEDKP